LKLLLLVLTGQEPNSNEVILLMMDVYGQALQVCVVFLAHCILLSPRQQLMSYC